MADAGVNQYTFHIEPVDDVAEVCRKIKENGMKVGYGFWLILKNTKTCAFINKIQL